MQLAPKAGARLSYPTLQFRTNPRFPVYVLPDVVELLSFINEASCSRSRKYLFIYYRNRAISRNFVSILAVINVELSMKMTI